MYIITFLIFKVLNKIHFPSNKNRMKSIANTKIAIDYFNSLKSNNLNQLLSTSVKVTKEIFPDIKDN